MSVESARRRCRRLNVLPFDREFCMEKHEAILRELFCFSPLVEGTSPGRFFVDLSGTRRLFGPPPDAASRVGASLARKTGLRARLGLSIARVVAQIAASRFRAGELGYVLPGGEAAFLAPFPTIVLPGVGQRVSEHLLDFGIQTIGDLTTLPESGLPEIFGRMGPKLRKLALGIDDTPVLPRTPKLVFNRSPIREIDGKRLSQMLFTLLEEACFSLRLQNRSPGRFAVEIRYEDGIVSKGGHAIESGPCIDRRLFRIVHATFDHIRSRRVNIGGIRLEFSDLAVPVRQMSLFGEREREKDSRLQTAMDGIRRRFGRKVVRWGCSTSEE